MPQLIKTPQVSHVDARLPGQNERLFAYDGEINASSQKDLLSQISKLMNDKSQHVVPEESLGGSQLASTSGKPLSSSEKADLVTAAFHDPSASRELGSQIALSINTHVERQGFARNLLQYIPLVQGQVPEVEVQVDEVVALIATSPSRYQMQLMRPNNGSEFLPEFDVIARPFIPRSVLNRRTDILQRKYDEALEAIMVVEDRLWRQMAVAASASAGNTIVNVGGANTPLIGRLRASLSDRLMTAQEMIIESTVWDQFITDNTFVSGLNPFTQYQLLLTGQLGTYFGTNIRTDATRIANLRVLEKGDMFVVSGPETHGAYSDRGGVEADAIDITHEKVAGRGWILVESLGMSINNAASVAHAKAS